MDKINTRHLFNASCVALLTTSMTFAIRAGMLESWSTEFSLSKEQVGWITSMAFLGFPAATVLGGLILDKIGMHRMLQIAFISHLLGLILTILAGGFWGLLISTFFVGFANGSVEAACNPLVATLFPDRKTTMLNRFHVWFPGGIVIGAVLSHFMSMAGIGWRMQVAIILIPALIYGWMFMRQKFPATERVTSGVSTSEMFRAVFANPLFYFLALCMMLTANTELSTGQWIDTLLKNTGTAPLLVLALINGIMAVGRFFAGPIVHRLDSAGTLLMSAILSALGLYWLSHASGSMIWPAAMVFAAGVCYFWPTMLGYVAEKIPASGALGLSLIGALGMMATAIFQPVIGRWYDANLAEATTAGVENVNLVAGQQTLANVAILPLFLIVAFGGLLFFSRKNTVSVR